jgi:CelD/BcsL family acetyltransferase involved in cellulose biosynthesis
MSDDRVRVVHGAAAVAAELRAADGLLRAVGAPVSARPAWLEACMRAFPSARPAAVVVDGARGPAAIACLAVTRRGLLRRVTLLGHGPSDHGRLPAGDGGSAALLAAGIQGVLGDLGAPWQMLLAQLPVGDPTAADLARHLPGARIEPGQACPQLAVGPERTLERHLSANTRRNTRRAHTRLARSGAAVRVERITGPAEIRRVLPEFVALRRRRDHALGRRSDLDDACQRRFYLDVVLGLAASGDVLAVTLRVGDDLAAYALAFRDRGTLRCWDGRISPAYASAGPGQIVRAEVLAAVLQDPETDTVDWMRGVLPHKMHTASHVLATEQLVAESSLSVRLAVTGAAVGRARLRAAVPDRLLRRVRASSTRPAVDAAEQDPHRRAQSGDAAG